MVRSHELVALPVGKHLKVDPRLPANRRYCRQWTAQFLTDLSNEFYEKFHAPLQVNSAVRTVDFQRRLIRYNGNAAPFEGERASSHLAGLTVDIDRRRITRTQSYWLEAKLLVLQTQGMVEVAEEFHQLCFHVMVSGRYPIRAPELAKNNSEKQ
jgi:ribulose kinase